MMRDVVIYGLIDPRSNELRYIGKTVQPILERLHGHLYRSQTQGKRHVVRWIVGLLAAGCRPEIFEIERLSGGENWEEAERFWIAYFKFIGANLTNICDGGRGVAGRVQTVEERKKRNASLKGRVFDTEWRRKLSESQKGIPRPSSLENTIKRMRAVQAGRLKIAMARTHCHAGHPLSLGRFPSRCSECRRLKRRV